MNLITLVQYLIWLSFLRLVAASALGILACSAVAADSDLAYQNRGDRYEGIRPKPVAGDDLELISVLVDYREETAEMPERLKVRFYLPESQAVHLTVREIEYDHYYWMDRVRPGTEWRPGFGNVFEWPTGAVLQRLSRLAVYDLGVVALIGAERETGQDRVAPVILYHHTPPREISAYLFAAKTNTPARLTCSIYRAGEHAAIHEQTLRRVRAGKPFMCRWDAAAAHDGAYRLVISGHSLDTSDSITQVVDFYHRPSLR